MAAEMLSRHARPDIAITLARAAAREKIDLIEYGYPVPPYAYPSAPEKALTLAIARQESNFNPGAMSYVGARGLMQLMPSTARALARAARIPYVRSRLVTDPAYNLRLGASYLNALLANFDGSYILAAAAYNAGPGRVRQWIRQFGDPHDPNVDPIDWVEQIPFNETRGYVQRVMENVMIYRAVLAGSPKIAPTLEAELAHRQPQTAQDGG
jgi:soluble lytic murein transglycosylase